MNTPHKTFIASCLFSLLSSSALAQSSGVKWQNGNVLTAQQLQQLDNAKMNVDSLGKPGFAPKLNAQGQITDPVVGSVANAPANAAGDTVSSIADTAKSAQITANGAVQANGGDASKTVVTPTGDTASHALSDVAAQATGSVQKTDANQPNGYAKLDGSGRVTVPTSGSISEAFYNQNNVGIYTTTGIQVCAPNPPWVTEATAEGQGFSIGDEVTSNNDGTIIKVTSVSADGGVTGFSVVSYGINPRNYANAQAWSNNPHGTGSGYAPVCLQPTATTFAPYNNSVVVNKNAGKSLDDVLPDSATSSDILNAIFNNWSNYAKVGNYTWPNATIDNFQDGYTDPIKRAAVLDFLGSDVSKVPTYKDDVSGIIVPYAGDSYVNIFTPYNGLPSISFSRVDKGNVDNTSAINAINLVDDDPINGANSLGFAPRTAQQINVVVTKNAVSSGKGIGIKFYDEGNGGYPQQNYSFQNQVYKYGLDWMWVQADELDELQALDYTYQERASNKGPSTVEYMAEHNLNASGLEAFSTHYSSGAARRTNQLLSNGLFSAYIPEWKANTTVPAHQQIQVLDPSTGYIYLYATDTGGTTGTTEPLFSQHENKAMNVQITGIGYPYPGANYAVNDRVYFEGLGWATVNTVGTNGALTQVTFDNNGFIENTDVSGTFISKYSTGSGYGATITVQTQYANSDSVSDGTVTWIPMGLLKAQIGVGVNVSAACNTPSIDGASNVKPACAEMGVVYGSSVVNVYNAFLDASNMTYKGEGQPTWARVRDGAMIDLTADGTYTGLDNHVFGYSTSAGGFVFGVKKYGSGKDEVMTYPFVFHDDGSADLPNGHLHISPQGEVTAAKLGTVYDIQSGGNVAVGAGLILGSRTKAQILAISSPPEGMKFYDTDDHQEVTYRCPTTTTCGWYAPQYEASPLSN